MIPAACNVHTYESLASTNTTAMEMAAGGCGHGTVVIANQQTAGRGRIGRHFYSPPDSGLYMSVVLRMENINNFSIPMITPAAAVAVCRAIEKITGKEPAIKWVNDILLDGKKVCGILTETAVDSKTGLYEWAVAGLGINVHTAGFPAELRHTAGSILPGETGGEMKTRLMQEIIQSLVSPDIWADETAIRASYKKRLATLGRDITTTIGKTAYEAKAIDIDESCRLIIKTKDGSIKTLSSGDITVQ